MKDRYFNLTIRSQYLLQAGSIIVNTSFGSAYHTDLFRCSSSIAVTNLSCMSVDDTIPNWLVN